MDPNPTAAPALRLHGYWRSSAAYRVRIALNLKGVAYEHIIHDLRLGEQSAPAYRALAPHGLVPALETGSGVIIESPAILEYLEERFPEPSLLPGSLEARATVRAMAALIACDIHPINNSSVLAYLRRDLHATDDQVSAWVATWIARGFAALETLVTAHGGAYAFGDTVSLADIHLVPQFYNAERFGCDLTPYPRLAQVTERARALPRFSAARPEVQADAG